MQSFTMLFFASTLTGGLGFGQTAVRIEPANGGLGGLTCPYQTRQVPPIDLSNSPRLDELIRGGNLYLTAKDAIALAIENSSDIEMQRYSPLLAREIFKRAEAGGALRSVEQGLVAGPQSVSLAGVSINAAGVSAAETGVSSGGGIVTKLGPEIPPLDPTFSTVARFNHTTTPQSNTLF